jgi:hypothetical protein
MSSNQSQDSAKGEEQSAPSEDSIEENELLKFLQWDKELDPASVAIIASHLDGEACRGESPKALHDAGAARREVLVRAALLLREARDIVSNGPSFEDLPRDIQRQFLDEIHTGPLAEKWTATAKFPTPNERFRGRAKIITGQKRAERAEADLREYLKHQCQEAGRTDTEATWNEFVRALETEDAPFNIAINHLFSFPRWKRKHKSEAARESRRSGPEEGTAKKS